VWPNAVKFLPVSEAQRPSRILFYRSAGGLPPTERPTEAIEAFLDTQWVRPPTGSISRLREHFQLCALDGGEKATKGD
jgi:hypothetical protein